VFALAVSLPSPAHERILSHHRISSLARYFGRDGWR
jgi:hypothetical protein